MNKKAKTNGAMIGVGIIAVVALVLVVGYMTGIIGQKQIGVPIGVGSCPDSAATVSFAAKNALSGSSSVATSNNVSVNGAPLTAAGTSYPVGAELEILWEAADYIATSSTHTVTCGGGPITAELYATDDFSFRIFTSNGDLVSNDAAGGTTNQTALGIGGAKTLNLHIDGTDKQSSGDLVIVVGHTNTTGCGEIVVSGLGGASKMSSVPDTAEVSGTKAYAYEVPAVIGAGTVSGSITIQAKTGQVCSGAIYVDAYSKQSFEDTDGSITVAIEDADDTAKYEDNWDYDFFVDAA